MVSIAEGHASCEKLLLHLKAEGIAYSLFAHPVVLTVEEQAKHVSPADGALAKNLLLKDKKGRLIVVTALTTTKVDLKLLSQRLGLGKSGLRLAPEENLSTVLQVPPGCVTPFALFNPSAKGVTLLLDKGLSSKSTILAHPLVNDATIGVSPSGLEHFLKSISRSAVFVDLEANAVVGKDQPPDLAEYLLEGASGVVDAEKEGGESRGAQAPAKVNDGKLTTSSQINSSVPASQPKSKAIKSIPNPPAVKGPPGDDVDLCSARILEHLSAHFANNGSLNKGSTEGSILSSSKEEEGLRHILVMFKNAAYTNGYTAGLTSTKRESFY